MKRLHSVALLGIAMGVALGYCTSAMAHQKDHKIALCHGTASAKHPYVLIHVDRSALKGHFDGTAPGHGPRNAPDFISRDGTCNNPPSQPSGHPS